MQAYRKYFEWERLLPRFLLGLQRNCRSCSLLRRALCFAVRTAQRWLSSCEWASLLCSQGQSEPELSRMDEHKPSWKCMFPLLLKRVTRKTCPHSHLRALLFNGTLFKMNSSWRTHRSATVGKADIRLIKPQSERESHQGHLLCSDTQTQDGQSELSGFYVLHVCPSISSPPSRPSLLLLLHLSSPCSYHLVV